MANDSDFDSSHLNECKLHNQNSLNLLLSRLNEPQDSNGINQLLDGIVGNQHRSKQAQIRCINPAIHAESLEPDSDSQSTLLHSHSCESNHGPRLPITRNHEDSTDLEVGFSNISINGDQSETFNTYRCKSLTSSTIPSLITSTNQSKSLTRVERRCRFEDSDPPEIQRYSLNGHKVIHVTTSLSSSTLSSHRGSNGSTLPRKLAHRQWVERKKRETLGQKKETEELELKKKAKEQRSAHEKGERERKERENFLIWLEKKKEEDARRRQIAEKELELERRLKEIEAKAVIAKEIYLRQWSRKKEKAQRVRKEEKDLRAKELEEEKRIRLEKNSKAFIIWREKSKNRPRPATQGLLPHHQATPTYINPIPWIVDDTLSEMQQLVSSDNQKPTASLAGNNIIKTIISQQ